MEHTNICMRLMGRSGGPHLCSNHYRNMLRERKQSSGGSAQHQNRQLFRPESSRVRSIRYLWTWWNACGGQYKVAHILYPYVSIKRAYKIYLTPHKSSPIKSSLFWLKDRKVPFKWIESGRYINIYNKCLYEESSQPYYKEMHKREVLSSQNASVCVPLKIK